MSDESLHAALRTATRAAHERLERSLGLIEPRPRLERFTRALQGLHAFHSAWEPRAAASLSDADFFEPRRRASLIADDLRRIGADVSGVVPDLSGTGADDPIAVWGGVYVLEGSTLGGKLISRMLAGAAWAPPGGLKTFDPYGPAAGRLWAECRARLNEFAEMSAGPIVAAALGTFACLEALCTEPLPMAAS